jgi:glycosyltransferase involved in cell wall biosynthesis
VKVLYIVTAYDRHPGDGITPWLVETIRRLGDRGIDVEVLAPSYRGQPGGTVEGVRVHRFRYAPARWEDLTHDQTAPDRIRDRPLYLGLVPGYLASASRAARRLVRRGDFDLVHVHWPLPHVVPGWAARAAAGIPLVITFHGVELTFARTAPVPFLVPFLRRAIRTADAVTANSTYTAGLIRRLHDRPVEIVPFGSTVGAVPAEARRDPPSRGGADGSAGTPRASDGPVPEDDGSLRLLFVGRLVERKGVHYLLDALAALSDRPGIRLDVVGQGAMGPALESRAAELGLEDRVRFHGFVDDDELARRYAEADAFVLPAVFDAKGDVEGLGVVLIEAATFGLPLVASAAGGITDIVVDGETGLLVPPGDADALARALSALADDPARARALGRGAAEHVARTFSWDGIIDRLERVYRELKETDGTE